MNLIFFLLIVVAFAVAAWRQIAWVPAKPDDVAPMQALTDGLLEAAQGSVTLAIGLIGAMALFLGLMKVAEQGGLLTVVARVVRPLMVRLFPDVPADHPAMGAMIMNIAANVLGLGNAATPFGIRAMQELDKLNPARGTASDAMVMFLAINTSSVTILPTGVIALRVAAGSADPAGILPTTLFATICSTLVAIAAVLLYRRWSPAPRPAEAPPSAPAAIAEEAAAQSLPIEASRGYPAWVSWLALAAVVAIVPLTIVVGGAISAWIIPVLIVLLLGYGFVRKVPVYECFVEGAKDGFTIAVRIIPYLVAVLVAVAMFRESGALDLLIAPLGAVTAHIGVPTEGLVMTLLRSLSGSGSYAYLASVINDPAIGPDSYTGYLVSTTMGSTETTFYVLVVYCGAV
ncbi:MAG TPA: nucleoside recognition domain-containing protein, partial [Alphaproteobacteria bacterium]